jgi:hypothetical protein
MKRVRHLPMVALVSANRSAMVLLGSPSELLRTMHARALKAAGSERLRANDCNYTHTLARSTKLGTSVGQFQYLRSQDAAKACTINACYEGKEH